MRNLLLALILAVVTVSSASAQAPPLSKPPVTAVSFREMQELCMYIRFIEFREGPEDWRLENIEKYNSLVGPLTLDILQKYGLPVEIYPERKTVCEYSDPLGMPSW